MQLVSHLVCTVLHVILGVKIKLMCHITGHTGIHLTELVARLLI